jgi:RNA polymerase-binding transcription factor DksA
MTGKDRGEGETRRAQILTLLTQRRDGLIARIRRALQERQEESQTRDAPGSHGWAAAPEGSLSLAMVQQQEQLLEQIDGAIRQHKIGAYGRCIDCDEEIAIARLAALPFAQRCAECQAEWETRGW